jgi:hypothetical protein
MLVRFGAVAVPTISVFYGIVIAMYFNDHDPPHFHVRYAEHRARVAIATSERVDGELPVHAARLVKEWTELHREELEEDWRRGQQLRPLNRIEPLP